MTILLIGKANTLSAQLRDLQLRGGLNNGPPIIPDDLIRDTLHSELSEEHARNVLNGDV